MRQRIVAAAVACDYAALAVLADEGGKGLRFTFGEGDDVAAFWRDRESHGEPVLARLVKILGLPSYIAKEDGWNGAYVWPRAYSGKGTAQDYAALKGIYPDDMVEGMRREGSYLGLRVSITKTGDWDLAVSGD